MPCLLGADSHSRVAITLFFLQFVIGLFTYYIQKNLLVKKARVALSLLSQSNLTQLVQSFMPLHKMFGFAIFFSAIATISMGLSLYSVSHAHCPI